MEWWATSPGGYGAASTDRPRDCDSRVTFLRASPLQLCSMGTPNGQKVTIFFEELLAAEHDGAKYDAWMIPIGDGSQFGSGFDELSSNSKIPTMLNTLADTRMFEAESILMQLSKKFDDAFVPSGIIN